MNETLQAKAKSNRPRCEAGHSPLPWKVALIGDKAQAFGGSIKDATGNQILLVTCVRSGSDNERHANARYIVKACNEFPQLEAQRDKYRKALEWIADKLRAEGSADTQDAFQIIHHIEATTNG